MNRKAKEKSTIVHIIDDLGLGGAQRQLVELLGGFPDTHYRTEVISLSEKKCQYVEDIRALDIPLTLIPQSGLFDFHTYRQLKRKLRELKPDIVQTWLFTADLYGNLAARGDRHTQIVSAMRNTVDDFPWHYRLAYRMIARRNDAVTINADAIRRGMVQQLNIPDRKIHTIHNGINLERFPALPENESFRSEWGVKDDTYVVAMVARMSAQKDHDLYLRAAAMVLEEDRNICFLLVGDGPLRSELERTAEQLGISRHLRFLGARRDVWALLNSIDLAVLTSHYEGCSNVIMEAMTASQPVIANNVGGNAELIEDNVTGRILKTRQPGELGEAIATLASDREKSRAMGQAGRSRVEAEFSMDNTIAKTVDLYQQLLGAE